MEFLSNFIRNYNVYLNYYILNFRYKYAIMEPAMQGDQDYNFGFYMKSGSFGWCAVGIVHKKTIIKNNY